MKIILPALAILAVAIVCVFAFIPDQPDGPSEDIPEPPSIPESGPDDDDDVESDPEPSTVPNGFSYSDGRLSTSDNRSVSWTVTDLLHTYMDGDSVYTPSTTESRTISLEPGWYRVTARGQTFELVVDGHIDRSYGWTYDTGVKKVQASVSYSVPISDLVDDTRENRAWNASQGDDYDFLNLPRLVRVDDTIRDLSSDLVSEYKRIGGSVSDRQGLADFIASFVQLCMEYPVHVNGGSWDTYVWGSDEYWCVPLETLYHGMGDCDDTAPLLCALYDAAGYDTAVGGKYGHVFSGVCIPGFMEVPESRLDDLGIGHYSHAEREAYRGYVPGTGYIYGDILYQAVETIRDQNPVGYIAGGMDHFDRETPWGWAGFYEVL